MKLTEIGEFGLIKAIEAVTAQAGKGERVVKGIGDDVAIIRSAPGKVLLVTTDLLLQDVHFTLEHTDPVSLGKKSLTANLSDIAACGGAPTAFVVSLALPAETAVDFAKALYEGMMEQAQQFNCSLVGGDTSKGKALMISVTLLGEAEEEKVVYRHGAKQGDRIFVTGQLGDSALGLEMLKKGKRDGVPVQRHLDPIPRVREGQEVARQGLATAMIDISDGLVADLGHVLEESRVGAQIHLSQIPLSEQYRKTIEQYQSDPYYFALAGGEDYEMLFTAPAERAQEIKKLAEELGTPITQIGEIVEASAGVSIVGPDGKEFIVEQRGHDHFKT
jgi:thiamine-monophosphate kinase